MYILARKTLGWRTHGSNFERAAELRPIIRGRLLFLVFLLATMMDHIHHHDHRTIFPPYILCWMPCIILRLCSRTKTMQKVGLKMIVFYDHAVLKYAYSRTLVFQCMHNTCCCFVKKGFQIYKTARLEEEEQVKSNRDTLLVISYMN